MITTIFYFLLSVFAVYRLTRMIANETGPFDVFTRLRHFLEYRADKEKFFFKLIDCFYCLSVWISFPFAFFMADGVLFIFLYWMAISGAACAIYTQTEK